MESKIKCIKCGSALCLRIKNTEGNTIKISCINCGEQFDYNLPFKKMEQDPEDIT